EGFTDTGGFKLDGVTRSGPRPVNSRTTPSSPRNTAGQRWFRSKESRAIETQVKLYDMVPHKKKAPQYTHTSSVRGYLGGVYAVALWVLCEVHCMKVVGQWTMQHLRLWERPGTGPFTK
ncbi:unnamed protein product, partial [Pleuronectes platessa]